MYCQGISQFYLHTLHFMRKQNEPYVPLPSHPQLVLIYGPRRGERLSRPWCEVAQAEIRTRNLPIANPALYHIATSASISEYQISEYRTDVAEDQSNHTFFPPTTIY